MNKITFEKGCLRITINQILSLLCSESPRGFTSPQHKKSQVLQEPHKSFHTRLVYHHHLHSLTACVPGDTLLLIVSRMLQALCRLRILALTIPPDWNALYLLLYLLQIFTQVSPPPWSLPWLLYLRLHTSSPFSFILWFFFFWAGHFLDAMLKEFLNLDNQ